MNNDKFVNYYMELLTTTFHDALGKNLVFQVQSRIVNEELDELKSQIKNFEAVIEEYKKIEENIEKTSHELSNKDEQILKLSAERDHAKNEASHIETFRNELISARNQLQEKQKELDLVNSDFVNKEQAMKLEFNKTIEELKSNYENELRNLQEKVEYLQLTPAKRKKLDIKKEEENSSDGGNF